MNSLSCNGILVIPCYNEVQRFPVDLWRKIISNNSNWGWYFVDDGSGDHTTQILEQLSDFENVRILRLQINVGKAEAVRRGMIEAVSDFPTVAWVGYIDSDGAFSNEDVSRLLKLAHSEDFRSFHAILGSRVKLGGREIKRRIQRHVLGRVLATLIGILWKGSPYDMQSGFKVFVNSKRLQNAIKTPFYSKWFLDLEIFIRISNGDFLEIRYWEEPLMFWQDVENSKLNPSQIFRAVKDFLTIAVFYRRTS